MMKEEIEKSFTTSFITNSIFKSLVSKQEINLTTILDMLINNKDTTKKEMLSLHKTFVIMPIRLTDILSPLKITYFDRLKAMFLAFFTIFADLKTKLAK